MSILRFTRAVGVGTTNAALRVLLRGPSDPRWGLRNELFVSVLREVLHDARVRRPEFLRPLEDHAALRSGMVRKVRYESVDAGGVPARWCSPPQAAPGRALVYFHGGGFVIGSLGSHADMLARIALGAGVRVLAVGYRLAPEHRYPAAHEDCFAAYRWAVEGAGLPAEGLVVGGDSAGGNLAIGVLRRARDAGLGRPAGTVLLSPAVDPLDEQGSMVDNLATDYLDPGLIQHWHAEYCDRELWRNPDMTPVSASLEDLGPLLIQAGGREVLVDQICRFAAAAKEAGNEVELEVYPHMFHIFQNFAVLLPEARVAIAAVVRYVKRRLSLDVASPGHRRS